MMGVVEPADGGRHKKIISSPTTSLPLSIKLNSSLQPCEGAAAEDLSIFTHGEQVGV